jgi:hypothetical protein
LPHVWNLRSRRCFSRIAKSFSRGRDRFGFRIVHFSVQGNHLHLVVEADDERALARGMQGLGVRIAKALNRLMARKGAVFADHYHARIPALAGAGGERAGVHVDELPAPLSRGVGSVREGRA